MNRMISDDEPDYPYLPMTQPVTDHAAIELGWAVDAIGRACDPDTWRTNPAMRQSFIGGSDAAAVVGIDPYRSPVAVWLQKRGRDDGFAGNEATDWGHRLERVVAGWLADQRPEWSIINPGERTWRHPDMPFMACTPDRIAINEHGEAGVIQIKTTSWRSATAWEDGDAPDPHKVQLAHEMHVLGLAWGALVCLVDGRYPYIVMDRTDTAQGIDDAAWLVAAESRFWVSLDGDIPPLSGHADQAADLQHVWHPDAAATVDLDVEAAEALALLYETQAQLKRLEATEARLKATVCAAMGDATVGFTPVYIEEVDPETGETISNVAIDPETGETIRRKAVTWSARTEVDLDRLTADHPDAVHACRVPTFSATALRDQFPQLAKDDTYRRVAGRTFRPIPKKDTPT